MADGFLSRWSRRKAGKEDDVVEKKVETLQEASPALPSQVEPEETPPPVTLEDVAKIDRFDPDFSAFMRPDVDPAVQQAALKKMFTDPHFNIMDGLDIYIDDYSKPDPLPPGMLERMVQSDMLGLFSKSSEVEAKASQQTEAQNSTLQIQEESQQAQLQSDLTSSQHEPSHLSSEMPNEVSIDPEQKKT